MNLDQINEVQEALEKKKKQEILKNEYKQRQALINLPTTRTPTGTT